MEMVCMQASSEKWKLDGKKLVKVSEAGTEWRRRSCCPTLDDKCWTTQSIRSKCNIQRQPWWRHATS